MKCPGSAREPVHFSVKIPAETGKYQWIAELNGGGQEPVRSLRDFTVVRPAEWHEELARGKPVVASSTVAQDARRANLRFPCHEPGGRGGRQRVELLACRSLPTRNGLPWTWGDAEKISRVELIWPVAYGTGRTLRRSRSRSMARSGSDVVRVDGGQGGREVLDFTPTEARWVRMLGHRRRSTLQGYTLFEFRVFR